MQYSIRRLCGAYGVDLLKLARQANISPLLVWDAFIDNPVERMHMYSLICGFNEITGAHFSSDDIAFKPKEPLPTLKRR
ncbi:MAG TPA: hypothetical protein VKR06_12805 [Ktedonosporobacter sp.]|nr:hypothetical protein [Ktedonosporobacter sp.]